MQSLIFRIINPVLNFLFIKGSWKNVTVYTKNISNVDHSKTKIINNWAAIITYDWAANQDIRMISEGSCDTEDWSNDAENSAFHQRNILQNTAILNCIIISQYYCFYCVSDQINAALVSIIEVLQKNEKKNIISNV